MDLKNGEVKTVDLNKNAVRAGKIAPGSIPAFTYQKSGSSANDTSSIKEVAVTCDEHGGSTDAVTGGGFVINGPDAYVRRSYAVGPGTWLVRAGAVDPGTTPWQLTVTADCLR